MDPLEIAEAWNLRRVSIVNASTVISAVTNDCHNYRHYAVDALCAFTKRWLLSPLQNPIYSKHLCTSACRMFEYIPPGHSSGDIFICRSSADMHVCTKDLCRHTHPQHGFPGYNNARRAVCHVCELTRRVFSVNPDQSVGGGGGGDGDCDDDLGGGGTGTESFAAVDIDPDLVIDHAGPDAQADAPPEVTPVKTAPKRKRATAAAAAVAADDDHSQERLNKIELREEQKKRFHVYQDVIRKWMPDVAQARLHAWQNAMEHIWLIIRVSPGFKLNRSQLQPQFFALVCLNYMRNIGLTIRVAPADGSGGKSQFICVLPPVPYIHENMPDIKHINQRQFTPAERALMCCVNELSVAKKMQLTMDNTTRESLYSFSRARVTRLCQRVVWSWAPIGASFRH